jgi:hypothetical protein
MGSYTELIIEGIRHEEDLKQINDYLSKARKGGYSPLVKFEVRNIFTGHYGEYNYFNVYKLAEFLEGMDWEDCMPEEHISLFVRDDEEFKYHEHTLKIPDQNWKNFGKKDD